MRKIYFTLSVILSIINLTGFTQSRFNGLYAGTESSVGINGMQNFERTYYFRPDGTYCSNLAKSDWKTFVSGTYKVDGKTLALYSSKGGAPNTMKIIKDDYLSDGGISLFKFEVMDYLPAQSFSHTSASSTGGAGTGTVYAGSYGQNGLSFDGKGHFSHTGFGSSMVAGDNVGGGSTKQFGGDGSYTINKSTLTLNYNDGKVVTKSFFYSGDKPAMALINGSIYYADENSEKQNTTKKPVTPNAEVNTEKKQDTKINNHEAIANGVIILQNANEAHGGRALDNLKTVRLQAAVGTMTITQLLSITEQKMRIEFYKAGKLTGIEQLEGNTGWQWTNGKVSAMQAERIKQMQTAFKTGILGLRSENLKLLTIKSAEIKDDGKTKTVTVSIAGQQYGWMFNDSNFMIGEVTITNGTEHSTLSKDIRSVNSIMLPYQSVEKNGLQTFTVQYTAIIINPVFTTGDWAKPE